MDAKDRVSRSSRLRPDLGRSLLEILRRCRPRGPWAVLIVIACVVIAAGTGLRLELVHPADASHVASSNTACASPALPPLGVTAGRGTTPGFDLLAAGAFGSMVASGPTLYALQACGLQETELRVVELSETGTVLAVSAGIPRAALLTSSLAVVDGSAFVAAARLNLSGPASAGPYVLTLYRMHASNLHLTGSREIGRGYGLSVATSDAGAAGATLVASTGRSLLTVSPESLSLRKVASFGAEVGQRIATSESSHYVAVSLFSPAAVLGSTDAKVELFNVDAAKLVSSFRLGPGGVVESMTIAGNALFIAAGMGPESSTEVLRLSVPSLRRSSGQPVPGRRTGTGFPATLESVGLHDGGSAVWAAETSSLSCIDPATGRDLGSVASPSPVSDVVILAKRTYVLTAAGIGTLVTPSRCRNVP
ncbi:MAG: hypothetical protein ACYCST_18260 [Acidimicrobiales bacterium]